MQSTRSLLMYGISILCSILCASPEWAEGGEPREMAKPEQLEGLPAAERDELVKQLNAEWLRIQEQLAEEKAARDKRREEARKRSSEEQARKEASGGQQLYSIDPLLKRANEMYEDYEHRNREEVIGFFEKYLAHNPRSPFASEVYAKMGSMYSYNANEKRGEGTDFVKMREYFQKAHAGYGGKYNSVAAVVYNRLTFSPGTLTSRLAYYDWLLHIQAEGTVDDIYGIRSINECIGGAVPQYSADELNVQLASVNRNLPGLIRSIEKQIFEDTFRKGNAAATYIDLTILAKRYPATELGRQAKHQIDLMHEETGFYLGILDDGPIMAESETPLEGQRESSVEHPNTPVSKQQEQLGTPVANGLSREAALQQTGRTNEPILPRNVAVVLAIVLVTSTIVIYSVWRRRSRVVARSVGTDDRAREGTVAPEPRCRDQSAPRA